MKKTFISSLLLIVLIAIGVRISAQELKTVTPANSIESLLGIPLQSEIKSTETVLILLRHAEKENVGNDPELSADGKMRAEELKKILKNVHVDAVFTTPFNRTRQTVAPLAAEKNLLIKEYSPKETPQQFIENIIAQNRGKVVVIVGHSNTIPEMVKILSDNTIDPKINDAQFDNLFVIKNSSVSGTVSAVQKKFGKTTP
ncbi:histidine phosphatase family protein [Chryseobacterium chendengshani]|uniref:phosphoglycerate mutase family protein n=1 Tax=Chryseobacterium sp. LJ668 TaxID=2864040 RepID=UPI001C692707|nr:phosphoglycerate mutase family protein [Chryseobacterium sp. LJ668]MBW8524434.1 histidine phosphatase family protein [Chryseobacterium sp. LJ668]QYK15321.1 histidine phosphatase family protein [Chryseobacterium sp. LJ668]